MNNRLKTHAYISQELSSLADETLSASILEGEPLHSGYGGTSVRITIGDTPIFVKRIPMTDLERQPENYMSTANIFGLPSFYQYGVGSTGFGAWRDLAAHRLTTDWVLTNQSMTFPILYHWRVLPSFGFVTTKAIEDIESDVQYWDNSPAIRNRLEGIRDASAHLVLFLEYIPSTLSQWLKNQLQKDADSATKAISFVQDNLDRTTGFLSAKNFVHFDAHFNNLLTDGNIIYFTDFGLALSSDFDLTTDEIVFLNEHRNYDRAASIASMVHCLVTSFFGQEHWEQRLRNFSKGDELEKLPPAVANTIQRFAPIALLFRDEFFRALQNKSKATPYPAEQLEKLLNAVKPMISSFDTALRF